MCPPTRNIKDFASGFANFDYLYDCTNDVGTGDGKYRRCYC